MRLFVALDIDDEIRNKISRFVDEMREFAPEARWVRPESLHVTLKFIGEKFEQEVEKIKLALGTMESKQLSCHSDPRAKRGTEESLPFFSSKIEMSILRLRIFSKCAGATRLLDRDCLRCKPALIGREDR
jgi:LigT like Phosphoesterase